MKTQTEEQKKEEPIVVKKETEQTKQENESTEKNNFSWKKKIQYEHGITVDTNKIIKNVRDRVKDSTLTDTQIAILVQTTIATIRDHLLSYNDIELDGIGRFYWKTWQNKKGENRYDFYLDTKFHLIDLYED